MAGRQADRQAGKLDGWLGAVLDGRFCGRHNKDTDRQYR